MGPLLGNELPMPAEYGVWSDERSNCNKGSSPNGLAAYGKSSALIVSQSKPSATELLLQNAIFLAEELDDGILLAADPASHGGNEDLPGLKGGGHPLILPTCHDSEQLSTDWQAG